MKKIFTLLFFAGLFTGAMAQDGRYAQHRNQASDNHNQSSVYAGNNNQGYSQSATNYGNQARQNNNGYRQNNGSGEQEQGYNGGGQQNYSRDNDRGYGNRYDMRQYRGNDHFDDRAYGYERRREYNRYNNSRVNARFSIRFGQPGCF